MESDGDQQELKADGIGWGYGDNKDVVEEFAQLVGKDGQPGAS